MRLTEIVSAFVEIAAGIANLVPGLEFVAEERGDRDHEGDMPIVVRIGRALMVAAAVMLLALLLVVVTAVMFLALFIVMTTVMLFTLFIVVAAVMLLAFFLLVMMAAMMLVLPCHYLVERLITY